MKCLLKFFVRLSNFTQSKNTWISAVFLLYCIFSHVNKQEYVFLWVFTECVLQVADTQHSGSSSNLVESLTSCQGPQHCSPPTVNTVHRAAPGCDTLSTIQSTFEVWTDTHTQTHTQKWSVQIPAHTFTPGHIHTKAANRRRCIA